MIDTYNPGICIVCDKPYSPPPGGVWVCPECFNEATGITKDQEVLWQPSLEDMPERYTLEFMDGRGASLSMTLTKQSDGEGVPFYTGTLHTRLCMFSLTAYPVRNPSEKERATAQRAAEDFEETHKMLCKLEAVDGLQTEDIGGVPHVIYVAPCEW